MRDALAWLLRSRRLLSEGFASAEAFEAMLDAAPAPRRARLAARAVAACCSTCACPASAGWRCSTPGRARAAGRAAGDLPDRPRRRADRGGGGQARRLRLRREAVLRQRAGRPHRAGAGGQRAAHRRGARATARSARALAELTEREREVMRLVDRRPAEQADRRRAGHQRAHGRSAPRAGVREDGRQVGGRTGEPAARSAVAAGVAHRQHLDALRPERRDQRHLVAFARLEQRARDRRDPAHLAGQVVDLVDALDRDRALARPARRRRSPWRRRRSGRCHGAATDRPPRRCPGAGSGSGCGGRSRAGASCRTGSRRSPSGRRSWPPTTPISTTFGPLVVEQRQQLGAQARVAGGREVVARPGGQRRQAPACRRHRRRRRRRFPW